MRTNLTIVSFFSIFALLLCGSGSFAQLNTTNAGSGTLSTTNPNGTPKDTTHAKSNTNKWKDEEATISYEHLNSAKTHTTDTSLHTFQRNPFLQPWYRDLGNTGSPAYNLLFTPENRVGPSLGYHVNDIYRFQLDSLPFYNTNRPYTIFNYQLGSKLEQIAGVMHTQNIQPNWNFVVEYRKTYSPGFYKIERNNNDNACFSTNYKSLDKHYALYAGMVYNKEQHDENGGIVNVKELDTSRYFDRSTVDVTYQNDAYSLTRSAISNMQRDFGLLLYQTYTFGPSDTTYNDDSTHYTYRIKPRFSIGHKLELSSEKHLYKDLTPDSTRYTTLFNASFPSSGAYYYVPGGDSIQTQQTWFWIDNEVTLNGFIGPEGDQLKFTAGAGNRFDEFVSSPVASGVPDRDKVLSNYLTGEIKKEALSGGQWQYGAKATFFATGDYAGNFNLNAEIGRDFKNNNGGFVAGFQQNLGSAPYSYTNYENDYAKLLYSFNKESITDFYATFELRKFRFSAGVKNYTIDNYIYINEAETPAQYTIPVNISQVWIRKVFKAGNFYLDNELVYQQTAANAPINVPALMGRHQFTYERSLFGKNLKIATGIEVKYNTSYHPAGYDALLNRFFYQNSSYADNIPEMSVFLNFRIKHFRAFIMGDQLQQIFATNNTLFVGTPALYNSAIYTPAYTTPNLIIRFGFSWILVN